MKQSQLFTKTSKSISGEDVSANAKYLLRGGFINQEIAGVYTFLPLGLRVLRNIEQIVREEMDNAGATEVLMPSLTSKESWTKTGRIESVDVLFKAMGGNDISVEKNSTEYILSPTHEEVIVPTIQKFLRSYKDFPKAAYQMQTKFRNEARAKSGILRGREFRMKDLYSFHVSEEDFKSYYKIMKEAYTTVFERLGIGEITKYTYASGGDFSKEYSNEFQTLIEVGEDEINICKKCDVAYNKEIFTENFKCLECGASDFEVRNASEVGNIFTLGTKYTDAFGFKFMDKDNQEKQIYMGCYGIGTSRVMGVIVEALHDDKGILWPESIAPFKYHLVTINQNSDEKINELSAKLYEQLMKDENGNVLWDDRIEESTGNRLNDSDLFGIPNRIIISPKSIEQGGYELKKRNESESKIINFN